MGQNHSHTVDALLECSTRGYTFKTMDGNEHIAEKRAHGVETAVRGKSLSMGPDYTRQIKYTPPGSLIGLDQTCILIGADFEAQERKQIHHIRHGGSGHIRDDEVKIDLKLSWGEDGCEQ